LYGTLLIIVSDMPGSPYLCALRVETGAVAWRTDLEDNSGIGGNSRTPIVVEVRGKDVLLLWRADHLAGHHPLTGRELWRLAVPRTSGDKVACGLQCNGLLLLAHKTMALGVRLAELGSETNDFLWKADLGGAGANCASPVLSNGLLFVVSDSGRATCLDAITGRICWRRELGGSHFSSPCVVGGNVYLSSLKGQTTVVKAETNFTKLAENTLVGAIYASMAPVDGQFFVRTTKHLYCIDETRL
jgi:outer membrane protein assembly factor BamB